MCLISQTFVILLKKRRKKKVRLYFIVTEKYETFCSLPWNVNRSTVVTIIYILFQDGRNRNVCSAFWQEQWLGVYLSNLSVYVMLVET